MEMRGDVIKTRGDVMIFVLVFIYFVICSF